MTVEIETAASTDEVTVTVTDRGPGFPELQRELVHENRAESPLEHGNGLGLWLARWITESYGGTLRLPETPDGATVEFTLDGRR